MKILAFGDIHLSSGQLDQLRPGLDWLVDLVGRENPDVVVCLGDLVEDRNERDHKVLVVLQEFFDRLRIAAPPTAMHYTLIGNHDIQYTPDEGLYRYSLSHVVAVSGCISTKMLVRLGGLPVGFGFSPYFKGEIPVPDGTQILFCHGDVADHAYGGRKVAGPSVVELGDLGVQYVFSGHVHVPEVIQTSNCRFEFVGALAPTSFSDSGDKEFGVTIIEVRQSTGGQLVVATRRMKNPHAIPYLTVRWREGDEAPDLSKPAKYLVDVEGSDEFLAGLPHHANIKFRPVSTDVQLAGEHLSVPLSQDAYVDSLIARWAQSRGADPEVGKALYYGKDVEDGKEDDEDSDDTYEKGREETQDQRGSGRDSGAGLLLHDQDERAADPR